jgi:Bacterial regulatory proteins, gntR family
MMLSEKKAQGKRSSQRAERIFNLLVAEIVARTIPAGQDMREAKIAREWGVSGTPVREAVRRVAESGNLPTPVLRLSICLSASRSPIRSRRVLRVDAAFI